MKQKIIDEFQWHRVFKILPVKTEDNYLITLNYVWRKFYGLTRSWSYHTNPDKKEDEYQAKKKGYRPLTEGQMMRGNPPPPGGREDRPPPPPAPPRPKCPQCGTTDCYKGPAKFNTSGTGVVHVSPNDILKSCKTRQQFRALERININGKNKK